METRPLTLLTHVRDILRRKHYSLRTEATYLHWIRRFLRFHGLKNPPSLRPAAPPPPPPPPHCPQPRRGRPLPLRPLWSPPPHTCTCSAGASVAKLLYGSGLRLLEVHRLRIKDLDLSLRQITIRDGKGFKDRLTMLPDSLIPPLREHLHRIRLLYEQDFASGLASVDLPYALDRKYPSASSEWAWHREACLPLRRPLGRSSHWHPPPTPRSSLRPPTRRLPRR